MSDIDQTLCDEALKIVNGNRREKYDIPERNFERIALAWQAITDRAYTAQEVALMFVALKLVRESHAPQRDNIVDGIGYLLCADAVTEKVDESATVIMAHCGIEWCRVAYPSDGYLYCPQHRSHPAAVSFKEQWEPELVHCNTHGCYKLVHSTERYCPTHTY